MRRAICSNRFVSIAGILAFLLGGFGSARAAYRAAEDGIAFSYTDPSATSVHLAGDFNEWNTTATPLSDPDGDGTWTTVIQLDPGRYEYKFVVDGGTWVADPDNPVTGGDFDNSIIEVASDGSIEETQPARPAVPSGTPVLSNTPLHGKVFVGGFFRMLMRGRTEAEGDGRLRVQRPEDQFNLDVVANLNEKIYGSVRLQVRTGEGGANELSTELYKAQTNFMEEQFQVKAYYNDEVYRSQEPLELLGHIDLRGTIVEEERPFGQGQQGVLLEMQPFGGELDFLYSDTFDRDIFNRSEPTVLDPRKDGLNQNTGTDIMFGRWSRRVLGGRVGLSYRGEFSDWWVNFTKQENPYPDELVAHREAQDRPNDDDLSDNFELTNDTQFGALDVQWPLPEGLDLAASAGYGWYESRWDLGNRETVQGQGYVNGDVDIPIGNQQLYRGKLGLSGERSGLRVRVTHELDYQAGMDAGENQVVYRTQPGSTIEDRDQFVSQDIRQKYQDVNGTDALDVLRLGPAPERMSHITEVTTGYDWQDLSFVLEFDRIRDNLDYADFNGMGPASLDRWRFRTSPRVRWQPFDEEHLHVSLLGELMRWSNPDELDQIAADNTDPALPAQGYGSLLGVETDELILQGRVPADAVLRVPLDLRFDVRWIRYDGPDGLRDADGEEIDLDESFLDLFGALVYQPVENVEVQLGMGVDPTFYDVISPQGWPNGRQQFRDQYLVDQRLDPYNPINVLQAEEELEDRLQFVINALVSF